MKRQTILLTTALFSIPSIIIAGVGDFTQNLNPAKTALRDLAADRPDSTESPITVDKGHWQIETSVVGVAKNSSGGMDTKTWTWGETNLKYGISNNIDLQLIFAPYIFESVEVGGAKTDTEDAGDITLRMKWNMWGNDGGRTSFALFPYVKIPTKTAFSNGRWEGGVILPFAIDLNEKWSLGLQAEVAYVYDEADSDHDIDLLHTAVLGYSVTDRIGVYIEYLGIMNSDSNPYESYASGGITYAITDQFQWDIGAVYGLNDEAEDSNVFTGFTTKF